MATIRKGIKKHMRWDKHGTISSAGHLMLKFGTSKIPYDTREASNLYLPSAKRMFKFDQRKKEERKASPLSSE